jgi:hypothetical protein
VFVYTGILPIAKTDDGLAAILGHEIAHNLARHQAENMSRMIPLQVLRWVLTFVLVASDSTGITMGLGQALGPLLINGVLNFGIMLPASRKQESEADYIGLLMMAESCYDPAAAVSVWQRMEEDEKNRDVTVPQWLSTHPSVSFPEVLWSTARQSRSSSPNLKYALPCHFCLEGFANVQKHTNRIEKMQEWLPKAEDTRNQSDCSAIREHSIGFQETFRQLKSGWKDAFSADHN